MKRISFGEIFTILSGSCIFADVNGPSMSPRASHTPANVEVAFVSLETVLKQWLFLSDITTMELSSCKKAKGPSNRAALPMPLLKPVLVMLPAIRVDSFVFRLRVIRAWLSKYSMLPGTKRSLSICITPKPVAGVIGHLSGSTFPNLKLKTDKMFIIYSLQQKLRPHKAP